MVRDHIPLEQGLRQSKTIVLAERTKVRDHIPLEQGLRLPGMHVHMAVLVRDHIPLEQGLRLFTTEVLSGLHHIVRDHIPLEQGLRL